MTVLWADGLSLPFGYLISAPEHFCSIRMKFLIKRRRRSVRFVRIGPLMFALLKGLNHFLLLMSMFVPWCVWHSVQKLSTEMLRFKCHEVFIVLIFYPIGVNFRTLTQKYFELQVLYISPLWKCVFCLRSLKNLCACLCTSIAPRCRTFVSLAKIGAEKAVLFLRT